MWFKNIHFYRFEDGFLQTQAQLTQALAKHQARNCGMLELMSEGWAKPLGHDGEELVHQTNGKLMLCLRREDKILPPSFIRERVAEKAFRIEQEQGRAPSRKEKTAIKEQVVQELLPRAFVRVSQTYGYIDPQNGWLIINASGVKKADEFMSLLRKSLGTLNITLPQSAISPEVLMTKWVADKGATAGDFTLEDDAELRSAGEQDSIIRCKHVDLASEEIEAHIRAGKRVVRLGLNWQDRISFILHENLSLHRMRYNTELLEEFDAGGDEAAQFDADFAIMAAELEAFLPELLSRLNTEEVLSGRE